MRSYVSVRTSTYLQNALPITYSDAAAADDDDGDGEDVDNGDVSHDGNGDQQPRHRHEAEGDGPDASPRPHYFQYIYTYPRQYFKLCNKTYARDCFCLAMPCLSRVTFARTLSLRPLPPFHSLKTFFVLVFPFLSPYFSLFLAF